MLGSMVEPLIIEHALWQRLNEEDMSKYMTIIAGHKVVAMDWLGADQEKNNEMESDNYI